MSAACFPPSLIAQIQFDLADAEIKCQVDGCPGVAMVGDSTTTDQNVNKRLPPVSRTGYNKETRTLIQDDDR